MSPQDSTPEGLTRDASRRIREQIGGDGLSFEHVDELDGKDTGDVYVADNTQQKIRGVFDATGVSIEPVAVDASTWTMTLEMASWGRDSKPIEVPQATRHLSDERLEYQRGDLVEWYRHGRRGIQHGFDVLQRPAGDGPLRIELEFDGTLQPRAAGEDAVNLLSKTGEHVLRYGGLVAFDADGEEVDARLEVADGRVTILVDDEHARYPLLVDPWIERKKLLASDGATNDWFGQGQSVSLSGDVAIVGAKRNGGYFGSAYVFARDQGGTDNWGEVKKLLPSSGAIGDTFGASVSLSGDVAVVSADDDDENGIHSGSSYVFSRDQGGPDNWGEVKKLLPSDGGADEYMGLRYR